MLFVPVSIIIIIIITSNNDIHRTTNIHITYIPPSGKNML